VGDIPPPDPPPAARTRDLALRLPVRSAESCRFVVPIPSANANIARHLSLMASHRPDQAALKIPRGRTAAGRIDYLTLTFAELEAEVDGWCARLTARGIRRGDRTLVMVRQGLPLIAAAFALFKLGAVPVVIDPGMGLKSFLACVARSQPRALVGIPLAQVLSRIFRRAFRSVQVRVGASGSLVGRLTTSGGLSASPRFEMAASAPEDLAAILFTSGSTGAPKGVVYEHGMFDAQVNLIRSAYDISPGEIDLPLLPVFALFNPALGLTTVVPEIDPRRPAAVDPAKIVQAIHQENVTNSFGSPTLWRKIGDYCQARGETLPSLRRVLCAGAPVPAGLWQGSRTWLSHGRMHSPYGATEALPVSTVSVDEIESFPGRGACVGKPLPEMKVKVIAIDDAPIATLAGAPELRRGEIGEIIVHGPVVTKAYDHLPEATVAAKIQANAQPSRGESGRDLSVKRSALGVERSSPSGEVWHRMGDCGYFDAEGRLWFCGRKAERVETGMTTLHTELCEQRFRTHPRVGRCALIGLGERGRQRPALVIEGRPASAEETHAWVRELRQLALQDPVTAPIDTFFFRAKFPVDVRHNAKIHRLSLAKWASTASSHTAA